MTPLKLAQRYLDIFYGGGAIDDLRAILADDLSFRGPFYRFDSAAAYIDALKSDPPEASSYQILASYEYDNSACLIYQFSKQAITTPMAQTFELVDGKIARILLIFDSAVFIGKQ